MSDFKYTGNLIKSYRESIEPELSQKDLSISLGYKNGQYISNIERGLCGIPASKIAQVAEKLKIESAHIVTAMTADYKKRLEKHCE